MLEETSDFTPLVAGFRERRKESPLHVLVKMIEQIHTEQKQMDVKLSKHMATETHELAEAITKMMSEAFPEGDPSGHRLHHELVIKQAEEKAKFWAEMRVAGAKWAGLGVLSFLILAAWQQFLKGPQ